MSAFAIDDLLVDQESLRDLNNQELKIAGGASTASSAGADYRDAVSAGAATTKGSAYANANGGYRSYGGYYYYGSYESGPSANASAYDRYDYYWYPYY